VTAELSVHDHDHLHPQRPDEQPISEQPEESENPSSPAGTIGEHHDIMSENIESNFRKFGKGKPYQNNMFGVEPTEMSNFAGRSEMTKLSKVAEVSPAVPVGDTSRAV
jgi:hypothetical protein